MESMPAEAANQYHPMDDGLQITEIDACGDELIRIAEDFARMDDGDLGGNVGQEAAGFSVPVPNINDLYLSFQGEVYVFHSVSPEKVQAVLLLLGGRQLPPGTPSISDPTRDEVTAGAPQSTAAYRLASLLRFRQKRKDRCFEKKIRYNVHKEVAQRMQRVKGHFASARPNAEEEIGSPALGSDSSISATEPSCEEAICHHCNVTEKSTPQMRRGQMRRGPGGSRTLCNACGLKWAMGKLNNVNVIPGQAPSSKFAA